MTGTIYFRAAVLGLLVANSLLLIQVYAEHRCRGRETVRVEVASPRFAARPAPGPALSRAPRGEELAVVDVLRDELDRVGLEQVLGLGPRDRILRVDGKPDYLDLEMIRDRRRVRAVVLLH